MLMYSRPVCFDRHIPIMILIVIIIIIVKHYYNIIHKILQRMGGFTDNGSMDGKREKNNFITFLLLLFNNKQSLDLCRLDFSTTLARKGKEKTNRKLVSLFLPVLIF